MAKLEQNPIQKSSLVLIPVLDFVIFCVFSEFLFRLLPLLHLVAQFYKLR